MKPKQIIRMSIDTAMVILLPLLMAYALIGEAAHEWLGIAMFLLFIAHHILNLAWYKNFFKGRYTPVRIFGTIINFLLLIVMFLLPISGIMMSRHVFRFLDFGGLSFARLVHLLTSYWGFVLMSVHIGLHGNRMLGMMKKAAKKRESSRLRTIILRLIAVILSAYGIYAFFHRQVGTYLFLQNQFVFFDYSQPKLLFFADYIVMMFLFSCMGYYISKGLTALQRRNK